MQVLAIWPADREMLIEMASVEVDVCIVGGGPAGMLLANLLASRGRSTLVVEKAPDFEREFRGEVLQPRFMRAMAQVGLERFMLEQPHERFDQGRFYRYAKVIGAFHFNRVDPQHPYVMWMTQPVMLRALHQRAQTFASFQMWFDARAHALIEDDGRVVGVRVVRGKSEAETETEVRARLVVGADGRFSTIMRLAALETAYEHYPFDVLWFQVERPPDAVNQISFFLSRDAAYLSVPKYPNLFQIGMLMRKGGFPAYRKHGIEALRREITRAHPWFVDFAEQLNSFSQFAVLQAKLAYRRRWARDGLVVIGDAAHTCSPLGAIGVSVAIETAIVAADVILATPPERAFDREVLDVIQARRARDVRRIHRIQRIGGNMVASTNPLFRAIQPLAVRVGSRLGLLSRMAARLLTRTKPLPIGDELGRGDSSDSGRA